MEPRHPKGGGAFPLQINLKKNLTRPLADNPRNSLIVNELGGAAPRPRLSA